MTVGELIKELLEYPEDLQVGIEGDLGILKIRETLICTECSDEVIPFNWIKLDIEYTE